MGLLASCDAWAERLGAVAKPDWPVELVRCEATDLEAMVTTGRLTNAGK